MIKKINRIIFETSDGREFEGLEEAETHELVITIADMLEDSEIYVSHDGSSHMEIARWIVNNKVRINKLLENKETRK